MKKAIVILLFLCSFTMLSAQIEDEIKSFVDTTNLIINNGRKLIEKSVLNNDFEKVREVYEYLNKKTSDSKIQPFYITEDVYINYLLEDWNELALILKKYDKQYRFTPVNDMKSISDVLYDAVVDKYEKIYESVDQANLDGEEKDFIKLLLRLIKYDANDEEYRKMYKQFGKSYSNSEFNEAYTSYLSKSIGPLAYNFYIGPAFGFPTGKLQGKLGNYFGGYMGMDFNVNKVYCSFYFTAGSTRAISNFDISRDGEVYSFAENDLLDYLEAGVSLGYFLKRTESIHITPFVSFVGVQLSTSEFNPDSDKPENDLTIVHDLGIGPGLHSEIKLFSFENKNTYYYSPPTYISLKLDVSYNYPVKSQFSELQGNFVSAKIGLAFGIGTF